MATSTGNRFEEAVERAVGQLAGAGTTTAFYARVSGPGFVVSAAAGTQPEVVPGDALRRRPLGSVEVRIESGDVIGVLGADGPAGAALDAVADLLGAIATLESRLLDENARAAQAEADALFDPLTGLGNRRYWARLLEMEDSRARRHGEPAAIIVADLDHLKEVNDQEGHAAGDDMLRRVAGVFRRISRDHDGVARLGGDEFALLAVRCGHRTAGLLAARLQDTLADEGIPASVGYAGRHPAGGLAHAWRRADAAMYADKHERAMTRTEIDLTTQAAQRAG